MAVKLDFGSLGFGGGGGGVLGTSMIWIGIIVFLFIAIGGFVIWWVVRKSYNKEVWVFKKIGGLPMLNLKDKGKLMAFGMAGDRLLQLQKVKKYLSPPQIQMGKELYWYWEREDGEYVNFSLADIDEVQKKAGAYFVDTDMRMQRLGIEKNLRDRLERKSWLEKYGTIVAGVIFVIMVTVCLVVLFSKLKDVSISIDGMAGSVGKMATAIEKFYTARQGGESPADVSGLTPAFILPFVWWRSRKWKKAQ